MDQSTEKALERVARLSGLTLSEGEKEVLFSDLSHIIPYMERITEMDTDGAAAGISSPEAEAAGYPEESGFPKNGEMLLREDEEADSGLSSSILSSAPETDGDMFCVPKAVE